MDIAGLIHDLKVRFLPKELPNKERQWLYDILAQRAELGSVNEALPVLIKRNRARGSVGLKRAEVLEKISVVLRKGNSISDSLKKMIPEDEYHLISAEEEASDISSGLSKASARLDQKLKYKKEINGVLSIIVYRFLMLVAVLYFLGKSLFPALEKNTPLNEWHPLAQFMYGLSTSVPIWFSVLTVILLGVAFIIRYSLTNQLNSKYRTFLMNNIQPWGVHRDLMAMTILDSFSVMVGVKSEQQALLVLKDSTSSNWLNQCFSRMNDRIKRGQGNPMLDSPLLPPEVNDVLACIGDGGSKDKFYKKSVQRLEAKINERITLLKKRIELIGTVVIYVAMGCMVISYILVSMANL